MAGFLLAHDFKVVVLEARRRVGGRVHSVWDGSPHRAELLHVHGHGGQIFDPVERPVLG
ncbi:MAG: NAD(P)-binding protein [Xanthobacteraceae bacterium]